MFMTVFVCIFFFVINSWLRAEYSAHLYTTYWRANWFDWSAQHCVRVLRAKTAMNDMHIVYMHTFATEIDQSAA